MKRSRLYKLLVLFCVAIFGAAFSACGGGTSANGSSSAKGANGTLTVDLEGLSSQIWLTMFGSPYDMTYSELVQQPLVYLNPQTLAYEPGLATSWNVSSDGLTWTFNLRKNVPFYPAKWGDVTSSDVAYTINLATSTKSTWPEAAAFRKTITSIDTSNPDQAVFHLSKTIPLMPQDLSQLLTQVGILSQNYVQSVGMSVAESNPVGTGAYYLQSQVLNEDMKFQAVPGGSWDDRSPQYKYIILKDVPTESSRIADVKSGAADISEIDPQGISQFGSSHPGIKIQEIPDAWNSHMLIGGLYFDQPQYKPVPYADSRVREAMDLALNRKALSQAIYAGTAQPATSWGIYNFSNSLTAPGYDPTKARQLLAEANWPSDYTFTIAAQAALPVIGNTTTLCEAISAELAAVGIKSKVEVMEASQLDAMAEAFNTDGLLIVNPSTLYLDPATPWEALFEGGSTYESFNDPKVDALFKTLDTQTAESARTTTEEAIQHQLYEVDYADIPILSGSSVFAVRTNAVANWPAIRGLPPSNLNLVSKP